MRGWLFVDLPSDISAGTPRTPGTAAEVGSLPSEAPLADAVAPPDVTPAAAVESDATLFVTLFGGSPSSL